jgi:hypothetical protein
MVSIRWNNSGRNEGHAALTQSTAFRQSQWYPSAMPRGKDFLQSAETLEAPAVDDVSK